MRHQLLLHTIFALMTPVFAADYSFVGAFAQDDGRRQVNFTLVQPGTVLIRSWSYAGGFNSAGARIEAGGFDPSLSLFDSSGLLLATNRNAGCNRVAADPVTKWCWDTFVTASLPKGTYQVVLTESSNTPFGPYLPNPFVYDAAGNFTAAPGTTAPAGFWDFWPNRRSNSYALDIGGADSIPLPPEPVISPIANSGSWQTGPAGPNTILTLFYAGLPGTQPFSILIDGQNAEILYNGPTVNFVVPPTATPKASASLQVWSGGNLLTATSLQIVNASPALFTANQSGTGQASVLNQDYSYNGAAGKPAKRGSVVMVYGTGFGAAKPPGPDGLSWLAAPVTATIGGFPAEVTFAGLAPGYTPGLQQINVRIPESPLTGPTALIRLQVGGHNTQPAATVAVE